MPSFLDRPILGPGSRPDVIGEAVSRGLFGGALQTRAAGRARRFFGPGAWRQVFAIDTSDVSFPARFTVTGSRPGVRCGVLYDRAQVPGGALLNVGDTNVETLLVERPQGVILEIWADDDVEVRPVGSDVVAKSLDGDKSASAAEIAATLDAADAQLDLLRDERDRILGEAQTLRIVEVVGNALASLGSALGLGDRADATIALLEQIDRFVGEVYGSIEAKAKAGDLAAAKRLERATRNILAVARGESPTGDLKMDAAEAVKGMIDDAKAGAKGAAPVLIALAVAAIVIALVVAFKKAD